MIPNAHEALSLYAEDEALPTPRVTDVLRKHKNIATPLSKHAFQVAVPVIENDSRVVRANITLETGLLRSIDETDRSRKLTWSAFLAQAARREIGG